MTQTRVLSPAGASVTQTFALKICLEYLGHFSRKAVLSWEPHPFSQRKRYRTGECCRFCRLDTGPEVCLVWWWGLDSCVRASLLSHTGGGRNEVTHMLATWFWTTALSAWGRGWSSVTSSRPIVSRNIQECLLCVRDMENDNADTETAVPALRWSCRQRL